MNFLEKCFSIHGEKYDYSFVKYINARKKVKILCKLHGFFEQTPDNHLRNHGCPKCNGGTKLKKEDFIKKSENKHGKLYSYQEVNYKNSKTKVIIHCKNHGNFLQTPSEHLSGSGCPKCGKEKIKQKKTLTIEKFLQKANLKHNNKYDYSLIKDIKSSKNKISIICKVHGIFNQRLNAHLRGNRCPKCKISIGEEKIMNFLIKNSIEYTFQKRFKECRDIRPLPFDFYLPKFNVCIEYDGKQHFKLNPQIDSLESFNDRKRKDNIKNEFCKKENNPKLVRVNYKDINKIDEILEEIFL